MDIKERCDVHGWRIENCSGQASVPQRGDTLNDYAGHCYRQCDAVTD
jgi:hypothetical protein